MNFQTFFTPKYSPLTLPDNDVVLKKGDGDGTVNLRSLEACQSWMTTTTVKVFEKLDHLGILRDPNVVDYVLETVKAIHDAD